MTTDCKKENLFSCSEPVNLLVQLYSKRSLGLANTDHATCCSKEENPAQHVAVKQNHSRPCLKRPFQWCAIFFFSQVQALCPLPYHIGNPESTAAQVPIPPWTLSAARPCSVTLDQATKCARVRAVCAVCGCSPLPVSPYREQRS